MASAVNEAFVFQPVFRESVQVSIKTWLTPPQGLRKTVF